MPTPSAIDWDDLSARITPNFTVHEALWLPSFGVHHDPTAAEKTNIVRMAKAMERVRTFIGSKIDEEPIIIVHCWIRPTFVRAPGTRYHGRDYNANIGGSPRSWHRLGLAVDFHVAHFNGPDGCRRVREMLVPQLDALQMRMENQQGSWIHMDCGTVKRTRYFKP